MDPDVVAAPLEGEPEGVAGGLGVAGLAQLDPFFVVELHLADAFRVDQDEVVAAEPLQAEAPRFEAPPRPRRRRADAPARRAVRLAPWPAADSRRDSRRLARSSPGPLGVARSSDALLAR